MFRLFFEETVLQYFKIIPARLHAQCLFDLDRIMHYGVTAWLPANVELIDCRNFRIICTDEINERESLNYVILQGHIKPVKNQPHEIYFTAVRCFLGGEAIGPWWKKNEVNHEFIEMDEVDLKARQDAPLLRPHTDTLDRKGLPLDASATSQGFIKRWFFHDLEQVELQNFYHQTFGCRIAQSMLGCHREIDYVGFWPEDEKRGERPIHNLIEDLKRAKGVSYVLVNFIDECDPLFHAQLRFLTFISHLLHRHFDEVNFTVIDVLIRDKDGREFHHEEFKHYYERSPERWGDDLRPFSMLLFSPKNRLHNHGNVTQLFAASFQTLYFDLFYKCRKGESRIGRDRTIFLKNRDIILHEMYSSVLNVAPMCIIEVKVLHGETESRVADVIKSLTRNSIVVRVNGDDDNLEKVKDIVIYPLTAGYPYITVVWADGNEDEVTLHNKCFSESYPIDNLKNLRHALEHAYEALILNQLPGNRTVENFYSGL